MQVLEEKFKELINRYSNNLKTAQSYWLELVENYNSKNRFYHNLSHLSELIQFFSEFESKLDKRDIVLFAIFYHDVIYDVKKNDNEEKSAEFAKLRLSKINFPTEKIQLVYDYIIATKLHKSDTNDIDLDYFLDFDMAILGKDWDNYLRYTNKIRKEYSIYPNILYRKGRKKVLKHFLENKQIYLTDTFFNKFEKQARKNIQNELNQ